MVRRKASQTATYRIAVLKLHGQKWWLMVSYWVLKTLSCLRGDALTLSGEEKKKEKKRKEGKKRKNQRIRQLFKIEHYFIFFPEFFFSFGKNGKEWLQVAPTAQTEVAGSRTCAAVPSAAHAENRRPEEGTPKLRNKRLVFARSSSCVRRFSLFGKINHPAVPLSVRQASLSPFANSCAEANR